MLVTARQLSPWQCCPSPPYAIFVQGGGSSIKMQYRSQLRVDGHPQYLGDDCFLEELRILVPLNIVLVLRGFQVFRYYNHA